MSSPSPSRTERPPLLKVIEYGILGGLAATPVSVVFRDFPYPLLSHLWARATRFLPTEQIAEIWTHVDIQQLKLKPHSVRVVLLHPGNRQTLTGHMLDWWVEQRRDGSSPLPSSLSTHHQRSAETPAAAVTAQCDDDQNKELEAWLRLNNPPTKIPFEGLEIALQVDSRQLRNAIQQADKSQSLTIRDINILIGLMNGVAINEASQKWQPGQPIPPLVPRHYSEVHTLLNSPPFHTVDQPFDELTHQMIATANLYLQGLVSKTTNQPTAAGSRSGSVSTVQETKSISRPRQITRRELADLGNPRSAIAKELYERLRSNGKGGVLQQAGSERRQSYLRRQDSPDPPESMPSWTYKMVRTRFDRLQEEGLIETRRAVGNGALEYLIPEELSNRRSAFSTLPTPEEVRTDYERG